ncbi:thiamine phosphate synthase [Massilia sp. IC2-477]|uniref:thiamine phosphate synthase n=1 Tax=unclassified Massilia TaxID=2609279 RepID=UPI001D11DB67|nr:MULTISPECIES: thiamine phosphate synthase [unclassified Massilia]MCC2958069.1 thiamine phosphate synthase [Massilia sp. IC2-477]MCC2971391.1 thiamine phosphate synthase [Massilia sp. IC2-476]
MRGLYLVTPDWDDTDTLLAVTGSALAAGASLVQYRHKSASPALRAEQAGALLALCRRYGRPLVINDHIDLCRDIDADGVHLGGTDAPVAHARALLGPDKIVGASCYGELKLAESAQQAGASYVAFGGFYPSPVKKYSFVTPAELVDVWRDRVSLPMVVIGGMTPQNAAPLVARGASMVAAITSVYAAEDPDAAVRAFCALFGQRGPTMRG